jgi:hypothetical protein
MRSEAVWFLSRPCRSYQGCRRDFSPGGGRAWKSPTELPASGGRLMGMACNVSRGDFVAGGGHGGDPVRGDRAVASDVRTRTGMRMAPAGAVCTVLQSVQTTRTFLEFRPTYPSMIHAKEVGI